MEIKLQGNGILAKKVKKSRFEFYQSGFFIERNRIT